MFSQRKPNLSFLPTALAVFLFTQLVFAQQQGPPPRYFNERFIIKTMAQLNGAQATYQATVGQGSYGSLGQLHSAGLIDSTLATGRKYGYLFQVSANAKTYSSNAAPTAYRKTGLRSYYIDQRGVLFGADLAGQPANPTNSYYIDTCALWGIPDNERCTIEAMRTLHSAQMTYAATIGNGQFASFFSTLRDSGLIDMILGNATKHGYNFTMIVNSEPQPSFQIWALPHLYRTTGIRSFYIGMDGVVRGADRNGGDANQNDPPVN